MNFGQNPTVRVSRETPSEIAPGLGDQIMVLEGIGDDPLIGTATSLAFWGGLVAAAMGEFRAPKNTRLRNQGLMFTGGAILVRAITRSL